MSDVGVKPGHDKDEEDDQYPYWFTLHRKRNRTLPGSGTHGVYTARNQPSPQKRDFWVGGLQHSDDYTRGDWTRHPYGRHGDTGNPFDLYRVQVYGTCPDDLFYVSSGDTTPFFQYKGDVMPNEIRSLYQWMNGDFSTIPFWLQNDVPPSENFLRTKGATAISRTIPNAPNVSVATSIAELKDGLFDIFFKSLRKGDVGGEFLNFQFGVFPTISDAKAIHETTQKAERIVAQWKRDSGRRVRRRYTFEPDISQTATTSTVPLCGTHGTLVSYLATTGTLTRTRSSYQKVWFSGAYAYHIPEGAEGLLSKLRETNRLYGILPTLSTAWELLPFSWLLDWESNVGDVLANISYLGQDGCVLTYGYIMCHTQVTYDFVWKGNVTRGNGSVPQTYAWKVVVDHKQRRAASPYGLGWTIESLSAKQIAILAALGISAKF